MVSGCALTQVGEAATPDTTFSTCPTYMQDSRCPNGCMVSSQRHSSLGLPALESRLRPNPTSRHIAPSHNRFCCTEVDVHRTYTSIVFKAPLPAFRFSIGSPEDPANTVTQVVRVAGKIPESSQSPAMIFPPGHVPPGFQSPHIIRPPPPPPGEFPSKAGGPKQKPTLCPRITRRIESADTQVFKVHR